MKLYCIRCGIPHESGECKRPTTKKVADTIASHWWGVGGCCCGKQDGVEFSYHLADLVEKKLNPEMIEPWHGKAKRD